MLNKYKILVLSILLIIVGYFVFRYVLVDKDIDPALENLVTMQGIKPGTKDSLEQISCNSADDIGYSVKGDKILITYGKQTFYILKSTLDSKVMKEYLKLLQLEILDKDGSIKILYKGVETSAWAK